MVIFRRFRRKMVRYYHRHEISRISEISAKNGTLLCLCSKRTKFGGFGEIFTVIHLSFYVLFPRFGRQFFWIFFLVFRRPKKKSDEVDSKDNFCIYAAKGSFRHPRDFFTLCVRSSQEWRSSWKTLCLPKTHFLSLC